MKRKIVFTQCITVFLSLLLAIITSLFAIRQTHRKESESTLRSDLVVVEKILAEERYKGTEQNDAFRVVANIMTSSSSTLRITIVSTSGEVFYDNEKGDIDENHLQRPEIQNLGKIYYRYSNTLKMKMIYIASLDSASSYYIRLAIPLSEVDSVMFNTFIVISVIFVSVLVVAIIVDNLVIKRELMPLKDASRRLALIAKREEIDPGDEIKDISISIDETEKIINSKISDLIHEKEKFNYIINTMKEGLIIIDSKENIVLINDCAKDAFNSSRFDKLSSLTIIPEIHDCYGKAKAGFEGTVSLIIEGKNYLVTYQKLDKNWIENEEEVVSLLLVDISEERRLESAKKDFFANASHELKSPLTSILGYTQMIREGFLTEKNDVDDALDKIQSEGKRMNEIIIEMLELSRLESGDEKKERKLLSLRSTVNETLTQLEPEIKKKDLQVKVVGDDMSLFMSKEELDSLVKNLIENAIRYNKTSGSVTITIDEKNLQFKVADTGIGFPEEDKERIFERFYRVDKARSRKLGGTGLGLAIVKHIAITENILINVDSILGVGTTFTLTFKN